MQNITPKTVFSKEATVFPKPCILLLQRSERPSTNGFTGYKNSVVGIKLPSAVFNNGVTLVVLDNSQVTHTQPVSNLTGLKLCQQTAPRLDKSQKVIVGTTTIKEVFKDVVFGEGDSIRSAVGAALMLYKSSMQTTVFLSNGKPYTRISIHPQYLETDKVYEETFEIILNPEYQSALEACKGVYPGVKESIPEDEAAFCFKMLSKGGLNKVLLKKKICGQTSINDRGDYRWSDIRVEEFVASCPAVASYQLRPAVHIVPLNVFKSLSENEIQLLPGASEQEMHYLFNAPDLRSKSVLLASDTFTEIESMFFKQRSFAFDFQTLRWKSLSSYKQQIAA